MRGAALPVMWGMCGVVPVSYLTHFGVSGETLASINSAPLPASAFANRNLESIFKPRNAHGERGGAGAAGRPAPVGWGCVTAVSPALSWLVLVFTGVI